MLYLVKAHTRKGHCYFFLKEYQKALEAYDEGLKIEPNNQELNDAVQVSVEKLYQWFNIQQREH